MPRLNALLFARSGVTAGLSGRQAYAQMQSEANRLTAETGEHWTGVDRTVFFEIYSGVRQTREGILGAMNAPKDVPGGGLSIPSRPASVASGFLHAGVGFVRPIGSPDIERPIFLIRSSTLLTPQEVEDRIREMIEESAAEAHGTFERFTIEGITFTGVEQLVRK